MPPLRPLPPHRFEYAEWRKAKANIDYHVEVDHNYYSVPYRLVHQTVDIRLTAPTVGVPQKAGASPATLGLPGMGVTTRKVSTDRFPQEAAGVDAFPSGGLG